MIKLTQISQKVLVCVAVITIALGGILGISHLVVAFEQDLIQSVNAEAQVADALVNFISKNPESKAAGLAVVLLAKKLGVEQETVNALIHEVLTDNIGVTSKSSVAASTLRVLGIKDSDSGHTLKFFFENEPLDFASTTPVSIKNNLEYPIEWQSICFRPFGTASASIQIKGGTSTISGYPFNSTSAPTRFLNFTLPTSTQAGTIICADLPDTAAAFNGSNQDFASLQKPSEYLIIHFRSENPKWAVTSTAEMGINTASYFELFGKVHASSTP